MQRASGFLDQASHRCSPQRNLVYVLAIAILCIVSLVNPFSAWSQDHDPNNSNISDKRETFETTSQTDEPLISAQRDTQQTPVPETVDSTSTEQRVEERSLEKKALDAQRSIARANIEIAVSSWWNVGVGAAGLLLLLYTLKLTRDANSATRQAVQVTRETSRRELRAYVGIEKIVLAEAGSQVQLPFRPERTAEDFIFLTMKNYGNTPAYNVFSTINMYTTQIGSRLPEDFQYLDVTPEIPTEARYQQSMILDPGRSYVGRGPFPSEVRRIFNEAEQMQLTLYVYGHIDYSDIFGRRWKRKYCFHYAPFVTTEEKFTFYDRHNEEVLLETDAPIH